MKSLEEIKHILHNELPYLKSRYGVIQLRIAGSYATGRATEESDIDILVDLEEGRSLMDLGGVQHYLERLLGKKVDVGEYEFLHPVVKESMAGNMVSV